MKIEIGQYYEGILSGAIYKVLDMQDYIVYVEHVVKGIGLRSSTTLEAVYFVNAFEKFQK